MFINFKIGLEKGKDLGTCGFAISSEANTSLIAIETLKEMKIPHKNIDSTVFLFVEDMRKKFRVSEEENLLGLDFLQEHGVLVSCNFRPDSCKC